MLDYTDVLDTQDWRMGHKVRPGEDPVNEILDLQARGVLSPEEIERIPRPILEEGFRRLAFTIKWHEDNPTGELLAAEAVKD